jgi:hypothetical protein
MLGEVMNFQSLGCICGSPVLMFDVDCSAFMVVEQTQLSAHRQVSAPLDPQAYPSVDRISKQSITARGFYQRYRNPGVPVVITGLLDGQPEWDLDFLTAQLGHQVFPVRHYGRSRYQQDKRTWTSSGSGVAARNLPFADYADMLRSGEAHEQDLYLARCSLRQTPLEGNPLLSDLETQLGFKRFPATYTNLWVGPAGHTSCLHYDPMDGLLMQVHGCKRFILFPPSQTYNLYPIPLLKQLRHGLTLRSAYSQVYPDRPDYEAFPKFYQAQQVRQEVILQPGEVLFLPAGWWHEVSSVGDGVVCSINRFWNVFPLWRGLTCWNKWRAHLSSLCAAPHIGWSFVQALTTANPQVELRKLMQRL